MRGGEEARSPRPGRASPKCVHEALQSMLSKRDGLRHIRPRHCTTAGRAPGDWRPLPRPFDAPAARRYSIRELRGACQLLATRSALTQHARDDM